MFLTLYSSAGSFAEFSKEKWGKRMMMKLLFIYKLDKNSIFYIRLTKFFLKNYLFQKTKVFLI